VKLARPSSLSVLVLVGAAAACCATRPLPLPMAPARRVALDAALSPDTLAVVDFVDARPEFEQSALEIDERDVGWHWLQEDRFFEFRPSRGTLAADPLPAPDLRARVTGEAAFAWYPFPNHGIGRPRVRPLHEALPDYVALSIEQRGLFARVIRAKDAGAARGAGATLVLTGVIERFGATLAPTPDPYVVRPDDPVDFRLLAAARVQVVVARLDDEKPLLVRQCVGFDEEPHLFDRLPPFSAAPPRSLRRLDASGFPAYAAEDLAVHARRALERATAPLIAALESVLAPPAASP